MKEVLIIGIIVVTACCAVAFGVHHEMWRTAQMRMGTSRTTRYRYHKILITRDFCKKNSKT